MSYAQDGHDYLGAALIRMAKASMFILMADGAPIKSNSGKNSKICIHSFKLFRPSDAQNLFDYSTPAK